MAASGISHVAELGLEERRQQPIDAQQASPSQFNPILAHDGVTLRDVFVPGALPLVEDIDAELPLEVRTVEVTLLELQDEFADQRLPRRDPQRPIQRQASLFERSAILLPFSQILV